MRLLGIFLASLPLSAVFVHDSSSLRYLWMASLLVNLGAIWGIVNVIRGRGGVAYLKAYLRKDASANEDYFCVFREGLFKVLPSPASRAIVFLGDSLTSSCEWHEMFSNDLTILNRGIGGDTSPGVLKRISTVSDLRPLAVFLMIGTNDAQLLGYDPADTLRNYRLIVQNLRQSSRDTRIPDTRIYVQSILPSRAPKFNHWSAEVNRGIRQLAEEEGVTFVDLRPAFMDSNRTLSERLTIDGLHLNAEGYLLWKRQIDPLVQEVVGAESSRELRTR
jgi:lysophospholipase L1-like esterase